MGNIITCHFCYKYDKLISLLMTLILSVCAACARGGGGRQHRLTSPVSYSVLLIYVKHSLNNVADVFDEETIPNITCYSGCWDLSLKLKHEINIMLYIMKCGPHVELLVSIIYKIQKISQQFMNTI
jgi:hypothetical protein